MIPLLIHTDVHGDWNIYFVLCQLAKGRLDAIVDDCGRL